METQQKPMPETLEYLGFRIERYEQLTEEIDALTAEGKKLPRPEKPFIIEDLCEYKRYQKAVEEYNYEIGKLNLDISTRKKEKDPLHYEINRSAPVEGVWFRVVTAKGERFIKFDCGFIISKERPDPDELAF